MEYILLVMHPKANAIANAQCKRTLKAKCERTLKFFFSAIHSTLYVNFKLKRHTGYFLINVYIPCSLLVVISWVAFWINREATGDRIALGKIKLSRTILDASFNYYVETV